MSQSEVWPKRAAGLLPALPARHFLSARSLSGSLQAGLAAAAYRLKEGDSVWLSSPVVKGSDLLEIVQYLHAVRLAGIHGEVRSSWINRPQMLPRTDMVVWTRASIHFAHWRQVSDLGVQWARMGRGQSIVLNHDDRVLRTLLCSPVQSLTTQCDEISRKAKPFLHVVDLTPFGVRDVAVQLLEHLESYFSATPLLVLTTSGDESIEALLRTRTTLPHWSQSHGDEVSWLGMHERLAAGVQLIELPDVRLEELLVDVLSQCRELKSQLERHPQVAKTVLPPIHKVIRSLRSLVIPVDFHEKHMERQRRGGLYPVLPLVEWLDRAGRVSLPTGQSEQGRNRIVTSLHSVLEQLQTGKSGKQQALAIWLKKHISPKTRSLLIAGSEGEAKVIRDWLSVQEGEALTGDYLTVVGASSARDLHRHLGTGRYDRALVITPLWESDTWALGLAKVVDWLAYPRECLWQQRVARQWLGAISPASDGKLAWWQWESLPLSAPAPPAESVPVENWSSCSGEYTSYNTVTCDIPDNPDWIADLMTPVPEPATTRDVSPGPGEVSVVTDEGGKYRYYLTQRVYVLSGHEGQETLETLCASELSEGQQLVEINDDDGTEGLLELLLEYAIENSIQYKSEQKIAERWQLFVDHAYHRCKTLEQFHQKLANAGVVIGIQQLKNWISHGVIGPNNAGTVVPAMARLSGMTTTENEIRSVINAQKDIHKLHREMGKTLKQMILAARAGNTTVKGSAASLIDPGILVDLVRVENIVTVLHHPVVIKPRALDSIEAILRHYAQQGADRMVVTNGAYRSARQSGFEDMGQVEACVRFLANDLFEVYGTGRRTLEDVLKAGEKQHIRFSGDTAQTTQGQFSEYQRTYKNRPVNIGKHLGIGSSRDPRRCFRLHFHWDDNDRRLVIHHAGRHLPTSQG